MRRFQGCTRRAPVRCQPQRPPGCLRFDGPGLRLPQCLLRPPPQCHQQGMAARDLPPLCQTRTGCGYGQPCRAGSVRQFGPPARHGSLPAVAESHAAASQGQGHGGRCRLRLRAQPRIRPRRVRRAFVHASDHRPALGQAAERILSAADAATVGQRLRGLRPTRAVRSPTASTTTTPARPTPTSAPPEP